MLVFRCGCLMWCWQDDEMRILLIFWGELRWKILRCAPSIKSVEIFMTRKESFALLFTAPPFAWLEAQIKTFHHARRAIKRCKNMIEYSSSSLKEANEWANFKEAFGAGSAIFLHTNFAHKSRSIIWPSNAIERQRHWMRGFCDKEQMKFIILIH